MALNKKKVAISIDSLKLKKSLSGLIKSSMEILALLGI